MPRRYVQPQLLLPRFLVPVLYPRKVLNQSYRAILCPCERELFYHTPYQFDSHLDRGRYDLRPKHLLGPAWNGMNAHFGSISVHLSGRNASASSPKNSGMRCIAWMEYPTDVPLGINRGDFPSWPPPRGSIVSASAVRWLSATGG